MNYGIIFYIQGAVLKYLSLFLCLPILIGLLYRERCVWAFMVVMPVCLIAGALITRRKPQSNDFYATEGYVSVSLSWILLSLVGALPFWMSGVIPSYTDALFETVSGFTTTGETILADLEVIPKCCLMWRSFTQWIGGMGVLVFVLAVLPMSGGQSMYLMKAESPGPSVEKLVPRVKNMALILYGVYTALTVIQFLVMAFAGMPVFDAVTVAFGTAGTGGFANWNESAAVYAPHLQWIITIFMILFGINFNAYYLVLRRKPLSVLKIEEVRTYLLIIAACGLVIAWNIRHLYGTAEETLRHAFFQVAAIISTAGFSTANFDLWPTFTKVILVLLTFIGACAGSTGGGMKVSRFILWFKSMKKELFTARHPHGTRSIHMDGRPVEHETLRAANVYLASFFMIFVASLLLISLDDFDFTTCFTTVAATLNDVGVGLGEISPGRNFAHFSTLSKYVLMFDMLAGRLELFPMMVLFSPRTWRRQ